MQNANRHKIPTVQGYWPGRSPCVSMQGLSLPRHHGMNLRPVSSVLVDHQLPLIPIADEASLQKATCANPSFMLGQTMLTRASRNDWPFLCGLHKLAKLPVLCNEDAPSDMLMKKHMLLYSIPKAGRPSLHHVLPVVKM